MTKPNEGQEQPAFPSHASLGNLSTGIAMKDYACIHLKVPKTGKPWLDALITESLRNEMAGRAMQGLMAFPGQSTITKIAEYSYKCTDAMLSTGKGEK